MKKYINLYKLFLKNSFIKEFSDPLNITVSIVAVCFWMLSTFLFYRVIYSRINEIAGWNWNEALILIATFFIVDGVLFTLFYWNFQKLKNNIESRELDFVLLKPVNQQFISSTQEIQASMYIQLILAIILIIIGANGLDLKIDIYSIFLYVIFIILATMISYFMWFSTICFAFFAKGIDNLLSFFEEIFNFAVYPSSIFSGAFKIFFNYIIPIAFMVTVPSKVLTLSIDLSEFILIFVITIILFFLTQIIWRVGIKKYLSGEI